jgi:hypothetical protein
MDKIRDNYKWIIIGLAIIPFAWLGVRTVMSKAEPVQLMSLLYFIVSVILVLIDTYDKISPKLAQRLIAFSLILLLWTSLGLNIYRSRNRIEDEEKYKIGLDWTSVVLQTLFNLMVMIGLWKGFTVGLIRY